MSSLILFEKRTQGQNATTGGSLPSRKTPMAGKTNLSASLHPAGKPKEITYHLNDLLRTTLATVGPAGVNFSHLTSFGQSLKSSTSGSTLGTEVPSSPCDLLPTNNHLPTTK